MGTTEGEHIVERPELTKRSLVDVEDIAAELRGLVRKGLPATLRTSGKVLPYLRNVAARAARPNDLWSSVEAITTMMEDVVGRLEGEKYGQAARILFGLEDGTRGLTLTARRERTAAELGYDVDHFRKRVEPRVLEAVAEAVYMDLIRYTRRRPMRMDAFQAFRPKVVVDEQDLTEEDDLVSRIWQHVYELRALRIREHRLDGDETREAAVHGDQVEMDLDDLCDRYANEHGVGYLLDGDLKYSLDGLSSLVVWRLNPHRGDT